jgi:hypothetical protein
VRPYAIAIRNNSGVSNLDKVAVGVTVPDITPTPIPAPATAPALILVLAQVGLHELQYRDSLSPLVKRKPFGVIGCQIWRAVGTVAATDPAQAVYYATATKTPFLSQFTGSEAGKHCTYFGRWANRSGPSGIADVGPWSVPMTVIVL